MPRATKSSRPRAKKSTVAPTAGVSQKVYVVMESVGWDTAIDSVYVSEDQAYAAAIRKEIGHLEDVSELCRLVTKNGASFKDKFKSMKDWIRSSDCWVDCDEIVGYQVKSCPVERLEKANLDDISDGFEEETDKDGASTKNGNGTATGKKRRRK